MDQHIRSQLLSAVLNNDNEKLQSTYEKIKAEGHRGATEALSPDLFVICAESAISINLIVNHTLIEEALTFYMTLKPKENQFLARSYLCYAHLYKPTSTRDTEKLEKCSNFILKAIEFGSKNSRYYFIVMNASILFWKLVRPFLVLQSIHHVVNTLGVIVKALTTIDDPNKKWLLNLSMSYIESLFRNSQGDLAAKETKAAIKIAKAKCPEQLPEIISKLSNYGLVSNSDIENLPLNLILIYEINSLKCKLKSESMSDSIKIAKSLEGIIGKIVTGKTDAKLDPDTANGLLLEVLVISLQHRLPEAASLSMKNLQRPYTDINFEYRIKFAEADLIVKKLGDRELSYKQSVLNIRLKAICAAQEALLASLKECDSSTIQSGCVTLWNLCLPLLQHNLRHRIIAPLKLIVSSLEDLRSMLVLLRCQVHIELAKCYQDQEKLVDALENFSKALNLDPGGQYKETILYHMKCINLKTNLYKKPDTIEEKAGFLLEQAKSAKDAKAQLQPILLKIGEYLAPNTFNWGMKELSENSRNCTSFIVLRDKITKYREAKEKSWSEMNRMGEKNTHERFMLWADVAKLARKEEVWDVALTASRFALWFESQFSQQQSVDDDTESLRKSNNSRASSMKSEKQTHKDFSKKKRLSNFSKGNAILLSELHFIYAESLIYFLMQEDITLGEPAKLPKHIVSSEEELVAHIDYPHWEAYCGWISEIQEECITHFIKGGQQGVILKEWWLVNNSCIYIWNYLKRSIDNNNHKAVIGWLSEGYNLLISSKGNADFVLVCQYVEALCQGYLSKHSSHITGSSRKSSPSKSGKKSATPVPKGKGGKKEKDTGLNLDPILVEDITKAVSISETVYHHIVGNSRVGLQKRKALLCLWVRCKQVLGQPLKTLLPDEENTDSFSVACKSIVAVEMNILNNNNYYVFPNTPSMQETLKMVENGQWSDKLIELETWTKLATMSLKMASKDLVDTCCGKIAQLKDDPDLRKPANKLTANKLICYHNLILGKSELSFGKKATLSERLPALVLFTDALVSAEIAKDYKLAMEVVQHFWNAILPHLNRKQERGLIKEYLCKILKILAALAPDKNQKLQEITLIQRQEIDLRAHLYSALFIIYLDERDWTSGLEASETAALSMPRPTHQLILKYRAIFKVNLGVSPNGDMAKLERMDSEEAVSEMWHRVAMSSCNREEQLYALQQSIMLLQNPDLRARKVDAVIRLADWLYTNQFPISDVLDQLEWALDIAVGLKSSEKGIVLMPVEEQEDSSPTRSITQTVRTKVSTQPSLSDEKVEIISKPKPLLSHVSETMEEVDEIVDLQRGELIARTLVIRSKMVLYSGGDVKQSILLAFNIYRHILETCLMNADSGGAAQATDEKPGTRDGKKGAKEGKETKGNAKLSSKSALQFSLPDSLADWSVYQLPSNLHELLKDSIDTSTVNKATFPQAELSLHYIEELCKQLELFGLIDHLLPLYLLQEVLAIAVLDNKQLAGLVHHRAAWNCQQLQLLQGYNYHIEQAAELSTEEEFVAHTVDLELYRSKIKQLVPIPMGLDDSSVTADNLISDVKLHDVQIAKAEILIKSGDFKSAVVLLEQAKPFVDMFKGHKSTEQYNYCSALLATAQSNFREALSYLWKIQQSRHSLDTASKLVTQILDIFIQKKDMTSAGILAESFISELESLQAEQKNHSCQIQYTISLIKCQVVRCKVENLLKSCKNLSTAEIEELLEFSKSYNKCVGIFSNLGFTLDACRTMYELSLLKFKLSSLEQDTEFHKFMFIEALETAQKALQTVSTEKKMMGQLGVGQGKLSLYTRCTVQLHCLLSNMYHYISQEEITKEKKFRIQDSQKEKIDKDIEAYISEPVLLSSLDETWSRMCYSAMELAKTHGDNAVRLCNLYHLEFPPDSQLIMGTALGETSDALFEDSLDSWRSKLTGEEIVTRGINEEMISLKYLTSSMEYLSQAVQIALLKQNHVALQSSCLEIISRLGFNCPQISVQYLCLYQSSEVAAWLQDLSSQALFYPNKSATGALLRQMKHAHGSGNYQLYNQCFDELMRGNYCWKRMLVYENHFDLLKDVDEKQYFLVLQHSPCKKHLYSGLLQGTKPSGKVAVDQPLMCISRHEVCHDTLADISKAYENYKVKTQKFLTKLVHFFKQQTQCDERRALLERLEVDEEENGVEELSANLQEEKEKLETTYHSIVTRLWSYLQPAIETFQNEFKLAQDLDSCFVLLADTELQSLPLEALPISNIGNLKQYTRDFSLQTYHHRLVCYAQARLLENPVPVDTKKTGKTPCTSAKGDRIKNILEKRLFTEKLALPPPVIDASNFKYILNSEGHVKCGEINMTDTISELLKENATKTSRWTGNLITDSQCSAVEVQELLSSASGFLYCGIGRFTALISPELLSCLNLSSCNVHIVADKSVSMHALRYQAQYEQSREKAMLALESPVELAALLYLNGSVLTLINTEQNSCDENVSFVSSMMRQALEKDLGLGMALHLTRYPPPPSTPVAAPTPENKKKAKTAKGKPEPGPEAVVPDITFNLPETLEPGTYNMAAFGVPQVCIGEATAADKGKK